jgi:hypothetical protein
MKRINLIVFLLLLTVILSAQPNLMNFQGVARDKSGQVAGYKNISLQIHVIAGEAFDAPEYTEVHKVTTSQFGVFNIHIGAGNPVYGSFSDIKWGLGNHYVKVEMDMSGGGNFKDLGTTQLLSVPYAFHAQTAGSVVEAGESTLKSAKPGVKSQTWSLFGNRETEPDKDRLGTADAADLVFITNNAEAMRILTNGDITIVNSVDMGGDLNVKGESVLEGNFMVGGETVLNGTLNVNKESVLEGTLTVKKESVIEGNLEVYGASVLHGNATFKGESVVIDNNLSVGNKFIAKGLEVKDNMADNGPGGFVAVFENTNNNKGDGINIKLGKESANNGLPDFNYDPGISAQQMDQMKELISCNISPDAKLTILQQLVFEGVQADVQMYGGLAVGVGNILIDFINEKLTFPEVKVFPRWGWSYDFPLGIGNVGFTIPAQYIGPIDMPDLPDVSLGAVGIDEINIKSMDFWGIPEICLDDKVSNPLNNDNEFIRFSDKTNNRMGAVRAESVSDWVSNNLTASYMLGLRGALVSTLDKKHARYHFKQQITSTLKDYTTLGVEYSSGNGDYAEWLERLNSDEKVSAGDIVGIVGGKITKDLSNAEQVMAVSHFPIVLGNVPEEGKLHLGNNIAFMGQIPVKVMGPVRSGDYIVGNGGISGYGVAISQEDMTIEDFKYAVGRSWDTNTDSGPKMINTVVGVHNGDYLNILKQYESRFKSAEDRLQALESKIEILVGSTSASK